MNLEERLLDCRSKEKISFHFPGHKGRCRDLYQDLYSLDTTETFGTDNLALPQGILKESMEEIAKIYKSRASYLGVGGSTMAIYAGLYSLTTQGQTLGLPRNSHRSLFQAAELLGLNIALIDLEESEEGLASYPGVENLKAAGDFDVLALSSPSYYGYLAPLKDLISYAHGRGIPVLVDEAHGGHLPFFSRDRSGLGQGADLVVHSVHKMLPGLTSTALLHAGEGADLSKLRQGLNLFTTTSPSYILMASLQKAVAWMDAFGRDRMDHLQKTMGPLYRKLDRAGIELLRGPDLDPFKWLIRIPGYRGKEVYEKLYRDYGLALEMHDRTRALAVISPVDRKEDLEELTKALLDFPKRPESVEKRLSSPKLANFLPALDRRSLKTEKLDFRKAGGRYAGNFVTPYPPGVPILYPGSRISRDQVDYLEELLEAGISLEGLDENLRMDVIQ